MKTIIVTTLAFAMFFLKLSALHVRAQSVPTFPHCINPQGEIKVSYTTGTHGVAGDSKTYEGADIVYRLTESSYTQCLCTRDGSGIQTNWWKISDPGDPSIQSHLRSGWILIPDGSVWGLTSGSYLAQNSTYSCIGGAGGGGNSNTTSSNTSSPSITQLTSLAGTGTLPIIATSFLTGFTFILAGLSIRKKG